LRVARARRITPEGFNGFDPSAFAPDADRTVAERSLDEMVAFNRKSAKTHSGIWRDIAVRKRRTETDAQLGPIAALGADAGVATPLVSRLIALMHDVEEGRRPQSHETLDALQATLPR
jgi:2-dehydropantoate 2-reductase